MAAIRCAVVGCEREGKPHVCPFDGRRHHHGRIHYGGDYPTSALTFHSDAWDYMCNEHYHFVSQERRAWELDIAALRSW